MAKNHKPTPTVHCIEGTEYERGWGGRPDGNIAFLTKDAAEAYIADYNAKYNNEKHAPDEYTIYTYAGILECSQAFLNDVATKGLKHFNRKADLTA